MAQEILELVWYFLNTYDMVLPISICGCMFLMTLAPFLVFYSTCVVAGEASEQERQAELYEYYEENKWKK